MADYFTHLAFAIPATRADAERFIMVIEAASAHEQGAQITLPPEIDDAFATPTANGSSTIVAMFGDDTNFGINSQYDARAQTLTIYDHSGSPALWLLADCLQRLFPAKLPLGFTYANSCSKHRPGEFGGGYFAIGAEDIVHHTLEQALADELTSLTAITDA